ncbi:MAG: hypothetical protein A2583_13635 [Bdellovibrionales bacterium RIFOXYD1_FULL_53_11]|nr:MAG: hypothetical protein A2583_13635 [Bdellovibrionales bacterium RIFOXYD1_FULL_53_11]
MRAKQFGITKFAATLGFLLLLSFSGCTSQHDHSSAAIVDAKHASENADVYTCPMHPQIKKSVPGQCPICGMNLEKVNLAPAPQPSKAPGNSSNRAPEGHSDVNLTMVRSQMIGVKLGIAERKPLFKTIRAAGRLAFDPELYTAQNEYIEARKQLDSVKESPLSDVRQSAKRMLDSSKLRLKILGLSDKQIANLPDGAAESGSGDVSLLLNKTGQSAWIYADIYEMDLPSVRPGLPAQISAGFLGGKILSAKVVSVDRVINPATRTAKARILLLEARTLLRPESYVDVSILSPMGEQITVPYDAVFDTGKEAWVFVADGNGNYSPRVVAIKFTTGDEIAIADGIKEGEQIVTSANFLIDSESRLRGAMVATKAKAPSCPKGQHWDDPMKMCMPDVGS